MKRVVPIIIFGTFGAGFIMAIVGGMNSNMTIALSGFALAMVPLTGFAIFAGISSKREERRQKKERAVNEKHDRPSDKVPAGKIAAKKLDEKTYEQIGFDGKPINTQEIYDEEEMIYDEIVKLLPPADVGEFEQRSMNIFGDFRREMRYKGYEKAIVQYHKDMRELFDDYYQRLEKAEKKN